MRVLFTVQPSTGHLHPLVPVAGALKDAGHDVAVCSSASFCAEVGTFGLEQIDAGLDWLISDRSTIWSNNRAIGRAKLDGTHVRKRFIAPVVSPCGVAVDDRHVYWASANNRRRHVIGRANLDGTHVDKRFITGAGRPFGLAVGPG